MEARCTIAGRTNFDVTCDPPGISHCRTFQSHSYAAISALCASVGSRPGDDAFLGRRVLENHALGRAQSPGASVYSEGRELHGLIRPPAALFRRNFGA